MGNLRTWATDAPDGTIHVVVINDALSKPRNVSIGVPATGGRPATVTLLRAPHVNSTSGVTLGGQSYGGSTSTGTLAGTRPPARRSRATGATRCGSRRRPWRCSRSPYP